MSEVSTELREANPRSSSMTALSLAAASIRSGDCDRMAPGMARSHMASRRGLTHHLEHVAHVVTGRPDVAADEVGHHRLGGCSGGDGHEVVDRHAGS